MNNNRLLLLYPILFLFLGLKANAQRRVVVLGSSTAAGTGASSYDSSWVGRLQSDVRKNINTGNPDTVVTNLAVGGYVTYQVMPTGYTPPPGKPNPDPEHNVTKALSILPEVIIISLPTNDIGTGYSETEFMNNLRFLYQHINSAGVKTYITTTQPRSQFAFQQRQMLWELVDSINNKFGIYSVNFWDDIATNDGQYLIKPEINSGDGVHLNNLGHRLLFERVKAKNIFVSLPSPLPLPRIKIEAENWSNMSGVQTETVFDAGGGLNVGWIEIGDWMEYTINPSSTANYTVNLRIATPNNGAQLQIKKADGTVLSTVNLPNTGAYQTWQTTSTTISLTAGSQTIRLQSSASPGWNINWLDLVQIGGNVSPSANAGSNQTITLPTSSVSLSGSGTDPDGTIASYAWSKISGPAGNTITSPSSASTTVTGLVQGVYTFRLTVTDNLGATGIDDVVITVNAAANQSPSANAGSDQTITLPTNSISLSGSGTDPDGTISSYAWIKFSGPVQGTITSPSSASTIVTGLVQGIYTFRLTVTDNLGATGIDDVVITVNAAANQSPSANAGSNQTITLPTSSVSLSGSGTDPDGTISSYSWSKISGPAGNTITSPSSASTTVTGLVQGVYTFRLTVTDNLGATGIDDVVITVNAAANQSPSANAGSNQTITLPTSSVSLSGSGTDPDGTISSYAWSKISGPAGNTITSPSSASTTVTGLVQGVYTFRLTVTDNLGAAGIDDVIVTVNAQPTPAYSLKTEAESYSSMNGVQTQSTQDAGGGLNVTGIIDNEWMDYSVNVPYSGTYTVNFRIATTKGGNKFQLRRADGTILATVSAPNTGGVQVWQTVSVTVNLSQGQQTFRIYASKVTGSLNINWWELLSSGRTVSMRGGTSEQTRTSSFALFPNPVQDRFILSLNNGYSGSLKVQIINMQGIVQKQFILNKMSGISQITLPGNDLPKGEYILIVEMNREKEFKKLTKL